MPIGRIGSACRDAARKELPLKPHTPQPLAIHPSFKMTDTPNNLKTSAMTRGESAGRTPRSLRFQLLLGVNVVMAGLLSIALYYDAQRELSHRVAERRLALEEESQAILAAVPALRHHGVEAVQGLLDRFCGHLDHAQAAGHQLVVTWDDTVITPHMHAAKSETLVSSLQAAAQSRDGRLRDLVVARRQADGVSVFVAENVTDIRREVRRDNVWRVVGLLIAAGIVDLILMRALIRPIERLVGTVREIAQGRLESRCGSFATAELVWLGQAIDSMSTSLADYGSERHRQLEKARQLQQHLLSEWSEIPGLRAERVFAPATEVSGDYHDLVRVSDTEWLLCIADVTGHGVPAAIAAAMLKTLFLQAATETSDPARLLSKLNERFGRVVLPGDFVTMLVLRWNADTRRLTYANAGHLPALVRRASGEIEQLAASGLMLGVVAKGEWTDAEITLNAGERVLLFTDGVSEALNAQRQLFGSQRVLDVFQATRVASLTDAARALMTAVESHRASVPQADDVTIILLEAEADAGSRAARQESRSHHHSTNPNESARGDREDSTQPTASTSWLPLKQSAGLDPACK